MFSKVLIVVVAIIISVHAAIDHKSSSPVNSQNHNSKDDDSTFNCVDKPSGISRFPHPNGDSTQFIFCIAGIPHSAKCWPQGTRFNPITFRCDLPPISPAEDSGPPVPPPPPFIPTTTTPPPLSPPAILAPPHPPNPDKAATETTQVNYNDLPPATCTTTPPTTTTTTNRISPTTTTPKPPILGDKFSFSLDCGTTHPCGLYPNHQGNCSTFFLCTETGSPIFKRCHGGQHFDTVTQECRPPEEAKCWEEPSNGEYSMRTPPPEYCPPHEFNSTTSLGEDKVLSTPNLTPWGDWGPPQFCPVGSFISGINVWRRVLQVGRRVDHAGLVSIALQCKNPDGVVTKVMESVAPGAPNDGFPSFYSCSRGVAVGFDANIQPDQGPRVDNLAMDNVQLACSCGPPAYKPYENIPGLQTGHRGQWIGFQSCGTGEALCGFQTQMAPYSESGGGQYDNTGLNNLRMSCCPVPDPVEDCEPSEKLNLIRNCDNSEGIYPRRCDFQFNLGTGYDTDHPSLLHSINFHQSLGHILDIDGVKAIKRKFQAAATTPTTNNGTDADNPNPELKEYSWGEESTESDSVVWTLEDPENSIEKSLYLPINTSLELYQVVGTCGHFLIRTNRFVRIATPLGPGSGNKTTSYFDV